MADKFNSWWLYQASFKNLLHDANDPDDQFDGFNAFIAIEARSIEDAIEWGDYLSKRYAAEAPNLPFMGSCAELFVEDPKLDTSGIPFIEYGYDASDEEIGW
ncbi:hypothetical protein [Hymenobacter negativus]|uniref:hypothetical protein n=1 Tax=Hymenobacter negativus TaxID=2795026 RepID=UPI001BB3D596|nr:hypothetical protein [Hymenobacter negativus]